MHLALCTWLEGRFCRSTVEIRSHIAFGFGLDYSHSGCIKLLARLGFEYRKPRPLPKLASAKQQASLIALYEPLMTGLGADEAVCFADAVHPEQQTKPAFGRVRKGSNPAVKTTAGRGRVNIHGALNFETFDAPFVEPTTVDGVSAAQLLSGTGARNPDKRIIHVFWHVIWHVISMSSGITPPVLKDRMSGHSSQGRTAAFTSFSCRRIARTSTPSNDCRRSSTSM